MITCWRQNYENVSSAFLAEEMRFEKQRVWQLLTLLGLQQHAKQLWDDYEAHNGVRQLTFESFDRVFPTFPWQLATKCHWERHWMRDRGFGFTSWFRHFDKTPIWDWYVMRRKLFETECEGHVLGVPKPPEEHRRRPFGLLFRSGQTKYGYIVHNGKPQSRPRHEFIATDFDDSRGRFCIELFRNWMTAVVSSDWTPRTDAVRPPTRLPKVFIPGAWVEPWVLYLLGTNSTAIVFGYLLRNLYWRKPYPGFTKRLSRHLGEVCANVDAEFLAHETGVSRRQARTALTELRKRGWIRTIGKQLTLNRELIETTRNALLCPIPDGA